MGGSLLVNAAIFWIDVVLLALLAGKASGAGAEGRPGRNAASTSFLLKPALVFDSVNGQTHAGWAVLVTGHQIAAAGPAAQVEAPGNAG